ncbi:MAG: AI-2E family transporter, partial [Candidatus Paceibacterota bacterium]
EISWSSLWRIFFMLLLVVVFILAKEAILILFLAIVISSALDAPVTYLEHKKIPRILGALIIFFIVLSISSLVLYTIVPITFLELKGLLGSFDKLSIPALGDFSTSQILDRLETGIGNFTDILLSGTASLFDVISSIFGGVIFVLATFILSFYLVVSRDGVEKFLRAVLPDAHEKRVIGIYLKARTKLGLWLQGQLILSLVIGLVTALGLWILGVKYSLLLGVLAGIFEVVPFVGPIFAGILAFIIASTVSLKLGIYVIIFFIIVQQLESQLLVPAVMKKTVDIHPVIVVVSLLAGAQIAGFIGLVLAVPVAVILQEFIEDWSKRKHNKLI